MSPLLFQYCQKIVVFSKDRKSVLLCKRKGENDYDGVFSFIGGKMEMSDGSLLKGMQREKNEEVGKKFILQVYSNYSVNHYFQKKDGNCMVLPHYYAVYVKGEIELNEEYSTYAWVPITKLKKFEPKIPTIVPVVMELKKLEQIMKKKDFVVL